MMPACDHTGTPPHFTSSTTSGSACLISARTLARVSPRQSPSILLFPSMNSAGEATGSTGTSFFCIVVIAFLRGLSSGAALGHPARQRRGLPDPVRHQCFVGLFVLVKVDVAHVPVLGVDRRRRIQRRAAE